MVLSSCRYYKQVPIDSSASRTWEKGLAPIGKFEGTAIKLINEGHHYQLDNYEIEGNTIKGDLVKADDFVIPDKAYFRRGKIVWTQRPAFRNTLFVWSQTPLETGPFSMDAEDATLLRYASDPGTGTMASVGLTATDHRRDCRRACQSPVTVPVYMHSTRLAISNYREACSVERFPGHSSGEDLLPLPNLARNQKEILLRVANELPEDEHINSLKLLKVRHNLAYEVGIDASGGLFEFRNLMLPGSAISNHETDLLASLTHRDQLAYTFDEESPSEELSSTILTFDISDLPALLCQTDYPRSTDQMAGASV